MSAPRAALVAAAVAIAVWLPSLRGGFLYDDVKTVVENRAIRDLGAPAAILSYEPARPLLGLSWALNYAAAGTLAWPYHLVNVLIHAGNVAVLASLFLWMARRTARPDAAALLGACLFAATPMAAETVAYVSSRSTALAALLTLLALRVGVVALDEQGRRRSRVLLALLFFLAGLATKEEAASLPLFLLLLDAFFVSRGELADVRSRLRLHALFFAVPVLGFLSRRLATGAWLPPPALEPWRYLATQLAAFPGYLGRAVVPLDPAFYRGAAAAPWPPDAATVAAWLATGALLAAALLLRRRFQEAAFAVLWLAAGLLPSSSVVALGEMVVDHRAYLGGAGVLYAAAVALWAPGRVPFAVALVTLLGLRSALYERVLGDPVEAWEDAVRRAPLSAEAHRALGEAYAATSNPKAEEELRRAVALDPRDAQGWSNLGVYYVEKRRWDRAEGPLRRAAAAAPRDARIRDNLATVLLALGRKDEALAEWEAARHASPRIAQPLVRLAEERFARGDKAGAWQLLDEASALELDAHDVRAIEQLRYYISVAP